MYSAVRASKSDNQNFSRQGSLRKVLPPEHGRVLQNDDYSEIYHMYRQEYIILAEYKLVQSENLKGVYVIPSRESPFLWFGFIYVREGPYEDGVFRFSIFLDEKFPDSGHPKVIFQSEIVHPVIHPESNELNLLGAFPTWRKEEQHIWQVLKYIQWIFQHIEDSTRHSINEQATELFQNREEFINRAKQLVKQSHDHLYDDPPTEDKHYISFCPYDPEEHDKVHKQMLNYLKDEKPVKMGLSWVLPGSNKPLGRPPTPETESES